jgi:glycosyltransferase involved in cell wall biosynthesis
MRIVIDMQGAQTESRFRGIGRYSMSLAQAIVRNRGEHEVILALNGRLPAAIAAIQTAFADALPPENIRVWISPGTARQDNSANAWHRPVAELIREAFLQSLKPDVIHITSFFEGFVDEAVGSIQRFDMCTPVSVSVYDLIPLLHSAQYLDPTPVYAKYYRHKVEQIQKASLLLAISESSGQEAREHLRFAANKVVNVSTAVDANFGEQPVMPGLAQALRLKYNITQSFVMYTGGADARKNLLRLISAYAMLPATLRTAHQLVFAGKVPDADQHNLKQHARAVGLVDTALVFTGYVPDEDMVVLYKLCKLFVFPSWHEGFGLPALEAMTCGTAVIAAKSTSLPEVVGWPDAMFDPFDEAAICQKMTDALTNDIFRAELAARGLVQSKKFSWDLTAKRAIEAFEALPHSAPTTPGQAVSTKWLPSLINAIAQVVPHKAPQSDLLNIAHVLSLLGVKRL